LGGDYPLAWKTHGWASQEAHGFAVVYKQRYFWENVEEVLDRLKLKPEERRKIVAAVAKRAGPPPTPKQRKQLDREQAAILGDLKGLLGQ
jgi:hypothetical protein